MIYLIVGLNRRTLTPWRKNVLERDTAHATRAAVTRARADGIDLIVAAIIGPNSSVLDNHTHPSARLLHAA
jgi:hypothetical protein